MMDFRSFHKKNPNSLGIGHIGYIKAKSKTCSCYDQHNPHMRKLNHYRTYVSDYNPNQVNIYIVPKDY